MWRGRSTELTPEPFHSMGHVGQNGHCLVFPLVLGVNGPVDHEIAGLVVLRRRIEPTVAYQDPRSRQRSTG